MRNGYTAAREGRLVVPGQGPQLVRWGSVFSGTIIAIAVFALLDALWLALSFSSSYSVVYDNLAWWIAGTAIFCMLLAGFIAGVTSGARGLGAGAMGGFTTWGLIVIAVAAVVVPTFAIGHVPNTITASGHTYSINYLTYWSSFWALLIGLAAAVFGGMAGGLLQRNVDMPYVDLQRVETETAAPTAYNPATGYSPAHAAAGAGGTPSDATETDATARQQQVVYESPGVYGRRAS